MILAIKYNYNFFEVLDRVINLVTIFFTPFAQIYFFKILSLNQILKKKFLVLKPQKLENFGSSKKLQVCTKIL
jgi:hypothetical protein